MESCHTPGSDRSRSMASAGAREGGVSARATDCAHGSRRARSRGAFISFRTVLCVRLRGELTGSRSALRHNRGDSPQRPEEAASVPPLPTADGGDSALNARHGTRATFLFLQMQGFL